MQSKNPEKIFQMAFERLVNGIPEILPVGSAVTQNNVAREAGHTPSALRKERFPALIKKIQIYVASSKRNACEEGKTTSKKDAPAQGHIREERLNVLEAESTNKLLSLLVEVSELRAHILRLDPKDSTADIIAFRSPVR
ncbi:hypothetical protein ACO0LL_02360 [Undibacterium sp. TC4M20W]|uniref:hypothetical protein n=1 Tax=Undibacterium sp. TC4M20W TaxID=3413052 RepID=UPI003BF024E9